MAGGLEGAGTEAVAADKWTGWYGCRISGRTGHGFMRGMDNRWLHWKILWICYCMDSETAVYGGEPEMTTNTT